MSCLFFLRKLIPKSFCYRDKLGDLPHIVQLAAAPNTCSSLPPCLDPHVIEVVNDSLQIA